MTECVWLKASEVNYEKRILLSQFEATILASGLTLRSSFKYDGDTHNVFLTWQNFEILQRRVVRHKRYSVLHIILFSLNPTLMESDRKAAPVICETQTCVSYAWHKSLHIISPIFTLFPSRQHLREGCMSMVFFPCGYIYIISFPPKKHLDLMLIAAVASTHTLNPNHAMLQQLEYRIQNI